MSRLVTTALVLLATTGVATELPEGGSSRKQEQVRIAGIVLKWKSSTLTCHGPRHDCTRTNDDAAKPRSIRLLLARDNVPTGGGVLWEMGTASPD